MQASIGGKIGDIAIGGDTRLISQPIRLNETILVGVEQLV